MVIKKIYFSHSMIDYNTPKEEATLNYLRQIFSGKYQVVCPNNNSELFTIIPGDEMKCFTDFIKRKEIVGIIIMEHLGHIGAGAFQELWTGFMFTKKVNVIRPFYDKTKCQWGFPKLKKVWPGDVQLLPTREQGEKRIGKKWPPPEKMDWKIFFAKINIK